MPHRFDGINIDTLTFVNYHELLPEALAKQIDMFIPPEGSFDERIMKRYVQSIKEFELEDPNSHTTLANRLRHGARNNLLSFSQCRFTFKT